MKGVNLSYAESILKKAINNELTTGQAAAKLGCSKQYVNKMKKKYLDVGHSSLVHGNKGRQKAWKTPLEMETKIVSLYESKYAGFNFSHFLEKLYELEGIHITYKPLYRILLQAGFCSPKHQKKMKKEHIHPSRPRRQRFGELLQIDASIHNWFGPDYPKATLHGAIDDASSMVMGLYFDREETIHGYYVMLRQILVKYGIPESFYGDNRTIFEFRKLSEKGQTIDHDVHIQFKRCCQQLGIELITTSVSQAKGRIERLWNTLQSRLVSELSLHSIKTIEEANNFLSEFTKSFNRKFALTPVMESSLFAPAPTLKEIDFYLSIQYERVIDNGSTFKIFGMKRQLVDDQGNTVRVIPKTIINIYVTFSGTIIAVYDENIYDVRSAETLPIKIISKSPGRPKWKPGPHHPWKKYIVDVKKG